MEVHILAFEWADTNKHCLIEVPIRIAAYIVMALVARYVLHRTSMTGPTSPAPPPGGTPVGS